MKSVYDIFLSNLLNIYWKKESIFMKNYEWKINREPTNARINTKMTIFAEQNLIQLFNKWSYIQHKTDYENKINKRQNQQTEYYK